MAFAIPSKAIKIINFGNFKQIALLARETLIIKYVNQSIGYKYAIALINDLIGSDKIMRPSFENNIDVSTGIFTPKSSHWLTYLCSSQCFDQTFRTYNTSTPQLNEIITKTIFCVHFQSCSFKFLF